MEYEIRKKYFRIGEVSDILHENISCVRFWASHFSIGLRSGKRSNKGYDRMFTRSDVARLHIIQQLLRTEQYSLRGALKKFKSFKHEQETKKLLQP